jgi:hypothetical protein
LVTINAFSQPADGLASSEGVTVGGGTIVNSGTIQGSVAAGNTNAVGRGITLSGNDRPGGGRDPIYGDAIVTNQAGGLIQGDSDSGIAVVGANASGHKVTIDNQAGATIKGGGTTVAAIDTEVMSGRTNLSGSIAGPMTVDTGAQLSPGASGVGVLTVGDTTLSTGSGLVIDLDPANGESDVLNMKGTVALNGADSCSIFCLRRRGVRPSTFSPTTGRTRFPGSSAKATMWSACSTDTPMASTSTTTSMPMAALLATTSA